MNPNLRYIGNEANFLKNIGFRIQFFRKKSGLSQEELAEKSGLSYSTISHIESSTPYDDVSDHEQHQLERGNKGES